MLRSRLCQFLHEFPPCFRFQSKFFVFLDGVGTPSAFRTVVEFDNLEGPWTDAVFVLTLPAAILLVNEFAATFGPSLIIRTEGLPDFPEFLSAFRVLRQ